jgi:hypothetical protein
VLIDDFGRKIYAPLLKEEEGKEVKYRAPPLRVSI